MTIDSLEVGLQRNVFLPQVNDLYVTANNYESPADIANLLHSDQLEETYPNVCVGLRIYLSLMVSNCSGERSFSKMALIKISTLGDRRFFTALERLSFESDVLETITFGKVIEQFASIKSRACLK